MCVYHVCAWTHRNQRRALDPTELELQRLVSPQVGAGNQAQNSARATSVLSH